MKTEQLLEYLGEPQSEQELALYAAIQSDVPPAMVSLDDAFNIQELEDHVEDVRDYATPLVGAFLLISLLRLDAAMSKIDRSEPRLGGTDFALIFSLVNGIVKTLGKDFPKKVPKGDAGLYLVARLLVTRLEERNPGIAESVGLNPVAE